MPFQKKNRKERSKSAIIDRPWDNWELDKNFIRSLSSFCLKHRETSLDGVFTKIQHYMEIGKDIIEFIPDGAFPARSFVKALTYLIQLGITVRQAKECVYQFVKQVVTWVGEIKLALDSIDLGYHFTWTTWRNLRKFRDLIDEICLWAYLRLNDNRWTKITNALVVGKEVEEFKSRLEAARNLFQDLTLINLSGGIDAIKGGIGILLRRQDSQDAVLLEIQKIQQQQAGHLLFIKTEIEAEKEAKIRQAFFNEYLDRHVVTNPTYDEQGKRPCEPGTRVTELTDILEWFQSTSPGSQNFLWLTGDPGCGKSAITASLAEHCLNHPDRVLFAQFFINRNNTETTDPNSYFPSIARQLGKKSPDIERAIFENLKQQPARALRMSPDQAAVLFVNTLSVASKLDESKTVAVIIDGLDETDKARLHDTAVIFSQLFKALVEHPNVKVFISSRTEDDIRNPFAQTLKDANVKHVHLDTTLSVVDVALFLRSQVKQIVDRYNLNWEEWPGEDRIVALGSRASGLFIWAVTAVRYIQERVDEDGSGCLEDVLNELTGEALEDINALYSLILRSTRKKRSTEWDFEEFRRIIGAIVVLKEPLCLDDLSRLLNLRHGTANSPADIVHFVKRLRTVLVAGTDAIDGKTIPRLHKSFFEFITDIELFTKLSLDSRFCVNAAVAEGEITLCCLQLFNTTFRNDVSASSSGVLKYASRFCGSHANATVSGAPALILQDQTKSVDNLSALFSTMQRKGFTSPYFLRESSASQQFIPPMAVYKAPTEDDLAKRFLNSGPGKIYSLVYSPNGEQLISGLSDGLLISWDVRTGAELGRFEGHTDIVQCIRYSPSGDRIVSGSYDNTIRIWDSSSRQLKLHIRGHTNWVYSAKFSPDGSILASGSRDETVRLWDADSGKSIMSPFQHDETVYSVIFTLDGNHVISATHDGFVHVWDRRTGKRQQKLKSFLLEAHSVAISPSGDRLAAIGDGGVCFWNRNSDGFIFDDQLSFKVGQGKYLFRIAFLLDENSVVLHYETDTESVHLIYDLRFRIKMALPLTPTSDIFTFSPDHSFVASCAGSEIHILPLLHPTLLSALAPNGDVVCAFLDGTVWLGDQKKLPVVSNQLEGKVKNVKHFTFSSDNVLLAAFDEACLYLWDVSTLKLVAREPLQNLVPTTSLTFLHDKITLTSTHEDGTNYTWSAADGKLHADTSSHVDVTLDAPLSLEVDESNVREIAGARWFLATNSASCLWAYIDGSLVRVGQEGSIVMLSLKETT